MSALALSPGGGATGWTPAATTALRAGRVFKGMLPSSSHEDDSVLLGPRPHFCCPAASQNPGCSLPTLTSKSLSTTWFWPVVHILF
jgi:hypothetical protein